MRLRSCLLHAVLGVLVLSSVAYAAPLPDTTSHSPPATACVDIASEGPVTPYANPATPDACPFEANPMEEMVRAFRRVQAAERKQRRLERQREQRERAARRRARRRAEAARSAEYVSENQAKVPRVAPAPIRGVIEAANEIATTPYSWGGGHSGFSPGGEEESGGPGYDCSGAVSYALHGGGLLAMPLNSEGLESWGEPGPGRWITVYTNADHAWMVVAGLAFDTVGGPGPRWHPAPVDSTEGFIARHPAGS